LNIFGISWEEEEHVTNNTIFLVILIHILIFPLILIYILTNKIGELLRPYVIKKKYVNKKKYLWW